MGTERMSRNTAIDLAELDRRPVNRTLPLNLLDAPRELGRNKVLKAALGPSVEAFLKLKMDEWNDSCRFLTRWDRDHALDC